MTPPQKRLGRHALGLPNGERRSYRNRFIAGCDHSDFDVWSAMVDEGLATTTGAKKIFGGMSCFKLTEAGARAALERQEALDREDFPQAEETSR